jgi:hypothetical protein
MTASTEAVAPGAESHGESSAGYSNGQRMPGEIQALGGRRRARRHAELMAAVAVRAGSAKGRLTANPQAAYFSTGATGVVSDGS